MAGVEATEDAASARKELRPSRRVLGRHALEPQPEGSGFAVHGVCLKMVAGLYEQVADATCVKRLTDQANRPVGEFIEGDGLFTDTSQFIEGVEAVAQGSLRRGSLKQLGAEPEVGQGDGADAGDWLKEVDVVLVTWWRLGPFEMQDALQSIIHAQRQDGLSARGHTTFDIWRQLGQPHTPICLQLGDGRPVRRRQRGLTFEPPVSAGLPNPDDRVNSGGGWIDEDVPAAGCACGRDDLLYRLLRQPRQIVGCRAKEGQLLQGSEFGGEPSLVYGRLRQALAHTYVRVGDRDDSTDRFYVLLIRLTDLVHAREVAQKRADKTFALSDGENGDGSGWQIVWSELRFWHGGFAEWHPKRAATRASQEAPPEVEFVGGMRLERTSNYWRYLMLGHDPESVRVLADDAAAVGAEGADDALEQQLGNRHFAHVALGQERQAHQSLKLGGQVPFLFEANLQSFHEAGVLEGIGDLGGQLEDDFVARPHPGGSP